MSLSSTSSTGSSTRRSGSRHDHRRHRQVSRYAENIRSPEESVEPASSSRRPPTGAVRRLRKPGPAISLVTSHRGVCAINRAGSRRTTPTNRIPSKFATPSWSHLAGTDNLGRDIFSRLIYGADTGRDRSDRDLHGVSLVIGLFSGSVAGPTTSSCASSTEGWFPPLVLAIVAGILGKETKYIILVIVRGPAPRLVRGDLVVRESRSSNVARREPLHRILRSGSCRTCGAAPRRSHVRHRRADRRGRARLPRARGRLRRAGADAAQRIRAHQARWQLLPPGSSRSPSSRSPSWARVCDVRDRPERSGPSSAGSDHCARPPTTPSRSPCSARAADRPR